MSIIKGNQSLTSVYLSNVSMKFPCSYFIQWRTLNSKIVAKTQKYNPQYSKITFNQKLSLSIQMVNDNIKRQFVNRETLIELLLVSKSRPDQAKLVGRVNIEVNKVLNYGIYEQPTIFELNCSSVQANIIMKFKVIKKEQSSTDIKSVDRSSFVQFISRPDFKSHNKYESIVLSRHENRSPLQKTINNQINKSQRTNQMQRLNKGALLKQSLFQTAQQNQDVKVNRLTIGLNNQNSKVYEIQQMNQSFSKASYEKNQMKLNLLKQRQQKEPLKIQIGRLQKQNEKICKNQNQMKLKLCQKDKQTVDLHDQIANLTKSIQNQRRYIDQLQHTNSNQAESHKLLEAQLRQQNMSNKQRYIQTIAETEQLRSLNQQLNKQVKALQSIISQLKVQIVQLKNGQLQTQRLREQLKKQMIKNQTLMHIKSRAESLQLQNLLLNRKIQDEQNSLLHYQAKFNNFQQLVVKLEQDNQKCHERVRQSQQIEIQVRAKLQQLQIQNNQFVTQLQNIQQMGAEQQKQIVQLRKEQLERQSKIKQLSEQIQNMSQQIVALKGQIMIFQHYNQEVNVKYQQILKELSLEKQKNHQLHLKEMSQASKIQPNQPEKQKNVDSVENEQIENIQQHINKQNNDQQSFERIIQMKNLKLAKEIEELKNNLFAKQLQIQLLKNQYIILKSMIIKNQEQLSSNQQMNYNKERQYQQMIKNLKNDLQQTSHQNKEYCDVITQYKQRQNVFITNLNLLQTQTANIYSIIRQKQQQQQKDKKFIQRLQSDIRNMNNMNNQQIIQQIFQPILQENNQSSSIIANHQQRRTSIIKRKQELTISLSSLMHQNSQIQNKINNTRSQISSFIQKHRLQRTNIQFGLKQLKECCELQSSIQSKSKNNENNFSNSGQKSQIYQYDIFKDKSKGKEYYQFEQQLNKLKRYVQQLQNQKKSLQIFVNDQQGIINELNLSNDELMKLLKQREENFNSMIIFNVLDQLKETLFHEVNQDDWNSALGNILNKNIIKQNVQKLLVMQQKVRQLSNEIQKIKFQTITINHNEDITEIIKKCECIMLQLIRTVTIINQ